MIVDETVRGHVPPLWFWALPGIDRIRAFDQIVRFDSPARALDCARAAREAVKRLGIDIRVGIHTGECELQGRALTGMAVHVAARIQGLAGPGDILVSSTVKEIVVGSDARFEDRGQHSLKGMPGEWRLFSLVD